MSARTTIWKFLVPLHRVVVVEMPIGAEVLHVAAQGEGLFIWARVNPDAPKETREFRWFGTGHDVEDCGEHIGTVHVGPFVWHLFHAPR